MTLIEEARVGRIGYQNLVADGAQSRRPSKQFKPLAVHLFQAPDGSHRGVMDHLRWAC